MFYNIKTYDFNNDEEFQSWFHANFIQGKYQPRFATLLKQARREWISMLNQQWYEQLGK